MSDVTKRILTGTVYVTLLLFVLMHTISALVLFLVVAILATLELKKIFEKQNLDFHTWPAIIIGLTSYLAIVFSEIKFILFLEIIIYFINLLFQTRKNITSCRWNFVQCYLYFHPFIIGCSYWLF